MKLRRPTRREARRALRRRALAFSLAFAVVGASARAGAQQEKTVQWNEDWPRVRPIEVANIVALTVGSAAVHATPYQRTPFWTGPVLFDGPVRDAMRLETAPGQATAALISDYLYRGMVVAPYIVDNYVVALGVHQSADVALQMTLINLQSLGLSGVLSLGVQHAIGRARPYTEECPPSGVGPTPIGFNHCGTPADNQSFWSGHAAAVFTMAGLTCVHHQHLPLYGGGVPDVMACAVMLAGATATGVGRLMSDRHWASDVVLGAGLGLFNGWFVPMWLHYGFGKKSAVTTSVTTRIGKIAPFPQAYEGGGGVGIAIF